ncbi:hypothetical protein AB0I28_21675 [Phytomonospora sp. NPDC050363]|uniref:hypothetical protein n=1 Tax=Phytomonospora sp. NPDC050363 TaxID=3155642 RepID=UPI0033D853CF
MTEPQTDHQDVPRVLPDWGLEPPQWSEEPAAAGGSAAPAPADDEVDPGGEGEPDPAEQLTWRSEANNPWSLDEDDDMPPPVVGGSGEDV